MPLDTIVDIYIYIYIYMILIQKDHEIVFTKENQRVVLFDLCSLKCVLNKDRSYSLTWMLCVKGSGHTELYTPGGTNQPLKTTFLRDSIAL